MTRRTMTRRTRWIVAGSSAVAIALVALIAWTSWSAGEPQPNHRVRDPLLARRGAMIYTAASPRALVVFFGNDVGFWRPHHELAADLAASGYDVIGVDIRPLFASLPAHEPERDSACVAAIDTLIAHGRRELGAEEMPTVIAGHSLGGELAMWAAAHGSVPRLAGVVALAPGARSHLRITPSDLLGHDPTGGDSFAMADVMRALHARGVKVAIVRGTHDYFAPADSLLLAQGATRYLVPLAGHSLRRLLIARYYVEDALRWVLDSTPAAVAKRG